MWYTENDYTSTSLDVWICKGRKLHPEVFSVSYYIQQSGIVNQGKQRCVFYGTIYYQRREPARG